MPADRGERDPQNQPTRRRRHGAKNGPTAGRADGEERSLPLPPFFLSFPNTTMKLRITRRQLLFRTGAAFLATALSSATVVAASAPKRGGSVTIHRLSLRGRRASKAAKSSCANLRFATAAAAENHRAHGTNRARVVPLTVSEAEYRRLFSRPGLKSPRLVPVADLRKLKA